MEHAEEENSQRHLNALRHFVGNLVEQAEKSGGCECHKPPSLLLVGPPGAGKTFLVKQLSKSCEMPLFGVHTHQVSDTEAIRNLFTQARENFPSLLFLDDVESIFTSGESKAGPDPATEQLREQLFAELGPQKLRISEGDDCGPDTGEEDSRSTSSSSEDSYDSHYPDNNGIIVVAATSAPWLLYKDHEMLSRFRGVYLVGLPDRNARNALLRDLLREVHHTLTEDDILTVADATEGYTPADLLVLVKTLGYQQFSFLLSMTQGEAGSEGSESEGTCESGSESDFDGIPTSTSDLVGSRGAAGLPAIRGGPSLRGEGLGARLVEGARVGAVAVTAAAIAHEWSSDEEPETLQRRRQNNATEGVPQQEEFHLPRRLDEPDAGQRVRLATPEKPARADQSEGGSHSGSERGNGSGEKRSEGEFEQLLNSSVGAESGPVEDEMSVSGVENRGDKSLSGVEKTVSGGEKRVEVAAASEEEESEDEEPSFSDSDAEDDDTEKTAGGTSKRPNYEDMADLMDALEMSATGCKFSPPPRNVSGNVAISDDEEDDDVLMIRTDPTVGSSEVVDTSGCTETDEIIVRAETKSANVAEAEQTSGDQPTTASLAKKDNIGKPTKHSAVSSDQHNTSSSSDASKSSNSTSGSYNFTTETHHLHYSEDPVRDDNLAIDDDSDSDNEHMSRMNNKSTTIADTHHNMGGASDNILRQLLSGPNSNRINNNLNVGFGGGHRSSSASSGALTAVSSGRQSRQDSDCSDLPMHQATVHSRGGGGGGPPPPPPPPPPPGGSGGSKGGAGRFGGGGGGGFRGGSDLGFGNETDFEDVGGFGDVGGSRSRRNNNNDQDMGKLVDALEMCLDGGSPPRSPDPFGARGRVRRSTDRVNNFQASANNSREARRSSEFQREMEEEDEYQRSMNRGNEEPKRSVDHSNDYDKVMDLEDTYGVGMDLSGEPKRSIDRSHEGKRSVDHSNGPGRSQNCSNEPRRSLDHSDDGSRSHNHSNSSRRSVDRSNANRNLGAGAVLGGVLVSGGRGNSSGAQGRHSSTGDSTVDSTGTEDTDQHDDDDDDDEDDGADLPIKAVTLADVFRVMQSNYKSVSDEEVAKYTEFMVWFASVAKSACPHAGQRSSVDEYAVESTVCATPSLAGRRRTRPLKKIGKFLLKAIMFILD